MRVNQDLVPSLKATIQNPANLCRSTAADGWIREDYLPENYPETKIILKNVIKYS